MNPVKHHHKRVVQALIWFVAAVSVAAIGTSFVVGSISLANRAASETLESYHLASLNRARRIGQDAVALQARLALLERAKPRAASKAAITGDISELSKSIATLSALHEQHGETDLANATSRLQDRFMAFEREAEDFRLAALAGRLDSFQLALVQLEKLHLMRAEQLVGKLQAARERESLILTISITATVFLSILIVGYAYRLLRKAMQHHAATESALANTEQHLRDSEKLHALGQLVGGIAHDFNNLLMIINGYIESALADKNLAGPARADLTEVLSAGGRAADLTRQLLTFSRQQPVEPSLVDLNSSVRSTESMLRSFIADDVEMVISLEKAPMVVEVDPGQLQQLLTNLILNAKDAITDSGRISISTASVDIARQDNIPDVVPGPYCRLSVTDTGRGMSQEVLKRAFEPFFTTKDVGSGTGLGLSTVHGIVRSHDGAILASSEAGQGTRFDIYLPRHAETRVAASQSPPARRLEGTEHVLLIEDEAQIRALTKGALENLGYTVLSAGTGQEAIDMAQRRPGQISLIISDVIMPGMTGPEAVAQILKSQPNVSIIYMSGYTDDVVLNAGVTGNEALLLNKPFQMEELARVIRDQLDRQFSTVA